ncbi:MAG: 1,4-dihydroxy-2-naphthoate octaprenyltransferase [Flavobacteriia bacterium]|nr:1,4-dihydroxy-2-naphthoate octaprenyltransferase [Flavobacteriia bacterium]
MILLKTWISAVRLRTLPLSISGILVGIALAKINGQWDAVLFWGAISTTLLFQITSNLANDLGDTLKGTDTDKRIGPMRGVQSGLISKKTMTIAILLFVVLCCCSSIFLIYYCSKTLTASAILIYGVLALLCIIAAITYTIGKKAYGYHGLGDLMVFIFFGAVSVNGSFGLFGNPLNMQTMLACISIGAWSVGVLNLNNMRDQENDKQSNKNTLAVKLGYDGAKNYHVGLIIIGIISWTILLFSLYVKEKNALYFIGFLPYFFFLKHLLKIKKIELPKDFDPELKVLALSTFFSGLLLFIISFLSL